MKKLFYILLLLPTLLLSQQNLPLNRELEVKIEERRGIIKHIVKYGTVTTSSNEATEIQVIVTPYPDTSSCFKPYIIRPTHIEKSKRKFSEGLYQKVKKENLIIINDTADKFYLTIDPLFNFEFGKDLEDSSGEKLYKNTRGVLVRGDIGNKFSFESSFYENQSTMPNYIDAWADTMSNLFGDNPTRQYRLIPGQGRSKGFKKNGYDYAMASGYVSYSPKLPIAIGINFQAGHGKHFVGDGYRSLLLSDNAFNYPYFRVTTSFGKIQYTNLYASFMNLTAGGVTTPANTERLFQKKSAAFQYLSWNIHKRVQLGIFQALICEASDSLNRQHLDFFYYNPVIGVSAAKYGLRDKNNVLLGANLKIKITNTIAFYSQYVLDDIAKNNLRYSLTNKQGLQIGFKAFDLFGIKNLHAQIEHNLVRPYVYSNENPSQSYSHYNQPLGDPLGANFQETIGIINYRYKDFFTEIKVNYAVIGADSLGMNLGNNIFASDKNAAYGMGSSVYELGQGIKTTLQIIDFKLGYLVNPSTNMNLILGVSLRNVSNDFGKSNTNFVYFGFRTSLANYYYDF